MSRIEFMDELRALLQDISAEEREEAMQYYNDYFDDAGVENEESIIKELGSPQRVAQTIKAGLGGRNEYDDTYSEYRETGYTDTRFEQNETPAKREGYRSTGKTGNPQSRDGKPWTSKTLKVILIILIIVIGVPVVIPAAGGILAGILGVLIAIVAVVAALLLAGIGIVIGGIALGIVGIIQLFYSAPVGFGLMGAGCLLLAVGAAMTALMWWMFAKVMPPVFRWFVELCRKPFQRRREEQQ